MKLLNELGKAHQNRQEMSEFEKGEHVGWFRRHVHFLKKTLGQLLQQGLTPGKISVAFSVGYLMGTFPVLGTHTILAIFLAWIFRLNQIAVNLGVWISAPFYLILLLPSLRVGEWVFGAEKVELDHLLENLGEMFSSIDQFINVWLEYGIVIGYACVGWIPVAFFSAVPVYVVTYWIAKRFLKKKGKEEL